MALNGTEFSYLDDDIEWQKYLEQDDPTFISFAGETFPLHSPLPCSSINNESDNQASKPLALLPFMPLDPSLQIKQETQEREEAAVEIESVSDDRVFDEKPQSLDKKPQKLRKKAYKLDESSSVENQIQKLNTWISEYKIKLTKVHLEIDPQAMDENEIKQEKLRVRQQKNAISAQISRWRKKLEYLSTQKTESALVSENESLKKRVELLEGEKALLMIQNDRQASEIVALKRELEAYRYQSEASVDIRVSGSPHKGFFVQYQKTRQDVTDTTQRKFSEPCLRANQEKLSVSFG